MCRFPDLVTPRPKAYLSAAYVPSITNSSLRSKAISFLRTDEQTMAWDVKLNQLGHLVQGMVVPSAQS